MNEQLCPECPERYKMRNLGEIGQTIQVQFADGSNGVHTQSLYQCPECKAVKIE